jgi:hypothetical protein
MAHQLFKLPKNTQIDSSVRVTPGAKAYFYTTLTTTPQDTFTTSALSVAHPNPVVADANGVFPAIYLDPALIYKLTLTTSADVLIYTVDPVNDQVLSQSVIGGFLYPQTTDEQSAGVTPVDFAGSSRPWTDAVKRYGLVGDGVTNNSTAFTDMLSVAGQALFIKRGDYVTGKFTIPSNTLLYMEPGTIIRDSGALGASDRFCAIASFDAMNPVENIHIIGWGAKFIADRADYPTGEQRIGVHIAGAVFNVCIEGLESSDMGGDGFTIGTGGGGLTLTPTNIRLIGVSADNNRRGGCSVAAGRNVTVAYSRFTNSNGTSPEHGVDVEPDHSAGAMVGDLEDVLFIGCYSEGNVRTGFQFVGGPYTAIGKRISVTFQDCVSVGDAVNFACGAARHDIDGAITFRNCKGYEAENNGFDCSGSGMKCEVDGMWIFNANQSGQVTARNGSSYSIYSVNATDGSTYGNVRIRNSYAYGTTALKAITQDIVGEPASVIANIDAEIHTDAVTTKRASYGNLVASQVSGKNRIVFTDETELATTSSFGSSTMTIHLNDIITNAGASGAISLSLSDATSRMPGVRVLARVKAAHRIEIDPGSGWTVGGGAILYSNTIGSEVTLESDGVGKWRIVHGGEGWHRDPIALDNSGTPSVGNGTMFETGGTTTITALDDGVEGQEITILVKHAVTIDTTGTTLKGNGGVDITAASGDLLRGVFDGTNWRLTFSDCSP